MVLHPHPILEIKPSKKNAFGVAVGAIMANHAIFVNDVRASSNCAKYIVLSRSNFRRRKASKIWCPYTIGDLDILNLDPKVVESIDVINRYITRKVQISNPKLIALFTKKFFCLEMEKMDGAISWDSYPSNQGACQNFAVLPSPMARLIEE
jgi:hypothetical protein